MKCFLLAITLAGVASGAPASAILAQKTYALGIGGGVAIPVGKLRDAQNTGVSGIVALALGVPELPIGVRFDGIYNRFSRTDLTSLQSGSASSYGFRIAGILGNLIYTFAGTSTKAYLIAGGGLYNTQLDIAGSKSENNPGLNAGAGLTFGVGPTAGFLEARYHFIRRAPAHGGVIHFVPITLGLMF
ncbi:MAG: hypothetical protein ACREMS_12720 [Gemmatimonadaceae bacterium]